MTKILSNNHGFFKQLEASTIRSWKKAHRWYNSCILAYKICRDTCVIWEMQSIIVIFNSHFQDNFDTLCVHLFRSDDDLDSIHNLLRKGHFCCGPSKGPRWFRPRLHMGSFLKSQKVSFFNTAFWQNLGWQLNDMEHKKAKKEHTYWANKAELL